jgi:hypothetical protein
MGPQVSLSRPGYYNLPGKGRTPGISDVNLKGPYMADSKFTKGQERAFYKLKKAIKDSDDVVYVSPPKKKR